MALDNHPAFGEPGTAEVKSKDVAHFDYRKMKWLSYAIDYGMIIATFSAYNAFASGAMWSPCRAAAIGLVCGTTLICVDQLKIWMWADVLAAAKTQHIRKLRTELFQLMTTAAGFRKILAFVARVLRGEGVTREFSDKAEARSSVLYHIFYWAKINLLLLPAVNYLETTFGLLTFEPLGTSVVFTIYMEVMFASFLKNAYLGPLHEMMHHQLFPYHKVHHMPMKELSLVNVWYFDIFDLVIEHLMAHTSVLVVKAMLGGGSPSVHFLTVILLLVQDLQIHAACPYSVNFFNPVLDYFMNPNVSHNLHHALNMGHWLEWPQHQLPGVYHYDFAEKSYVDGSLEGDFATYNKVFGTCFPP